jgi:hypothetical protein
VNTDFFVFPIPQTGTSATDQLFFIIADSNVDACLISINRLHCSRSRMAANYRAVEFPFDDSVVVRPHLSRRSKTESAAPVNSSALFDPSDFLKAEVRGIHVGVANAKSATL